MNFFPTAERDLDGVSLPSYLFHIYIYFFYFVFYKIIIDEIFFSVYDVIDSKQTKWSHGGPWRRRGSK
jgi:hypothetical protein